jgi:hypothetical protein
VFGGDPVVRVFGRRCAARCDHKER